MNRDDPQAGQASVELVAALPVLVLLTALVVQAALAGWSLWSAQNAAWAGARAAAVEGDANKAARSALPGQLDANARVTSDGPVSVSVVAPSVISSRTRVQAVAGSGLPGADSGTR